MGRGIVHPVDAMDTEPWNEDLLDYLAVRFAEDQDYDLKKALAYICFVTDLSVGVHRHRPGTTIPSCIRGPLAKRMTAEQFVDAVWQITGTAPEKPHKAIARGGGRSAAQWCAPRWCTAIS